MLPRISKRQFEKKLKQYYTIEEQEAIEARIARNPKEYQMDNIFEADGYRGWLSVYENVHEEIIYGIE